MRRTLIGLLRTLLASAILVGLNQARLVVGHASTQQQDEAITRASILEESGVPGEARPAAVILTLAKGVEVGFLSMAIRFPTKLVTFQRVELSGVADGVGAEAKAELKNEDKDEAVLQLTIATVEKDGRRMLPEGSLANVWFKIADDAKPETVIPLKIVTATLTSKAGAEAVNLETRDGQITVAAAIVSACFFYMH